jgi:hypothetical protein
LLRHTSERGVGTRERRMEPPRAAEQEWVTYSRREYTGIIIIIKQ